MKETSTNTTIKVCDLISKGALYLLAFLLPIFVSSMTINVLDFNKQILLIALVLVSLFAWMLKILISGKFELNLTSIHIPIGILFLVTTFSTIFSLWRYGSFWGWPLVSSESLFTLIGFCLFYFLVSNILKKKEVFYLVISLVLSGFFVMVYGIFQMFGKFILPFDFSKISSFNTIGTINSLGIFAAVILPLIIISIINSKRVLRAIFLIILLLDILLLILVNFSVCWWIVIIASALVMAVFTQKSKFIDGHWIIIPMFFLAIALLFVFFKFQVFKLPSRPIEVYLNQETSFDIAKKTLKESSILGSGPGTFLYDFTKHKDIVLNEGSFWNVKFDKAGSKFMNVLATTGILGALSFVALILFFITYGVKNLFVKEFRSPSKEDTPENDHGFLWITASGLFISFVAISIQSFFYHSNLTLNFISFLLIGGFTALVAQRKEIVLKTSPLLNLVVNFSLTLIVIFGLGLFILGGQRYAAEANYLEGVKGLREGNVNYSVEKLERAINLNPKIDLYWRDISRVYLAKIDIEAADTDSSTEETSKRIQVLINRSVGSAKQATDINPKNVANWLNRGSVYQDLIGVVGGVEDWAIKSYEDAILLEPINPYYFTQTGMVYLKKSMLVSKEDVEEKQKIYIEAQRNFEKAVELKSDYAQARFQLSMVYQAQGKAEQAIEELEATKKLVPFDLGLAFQLGLVYYQNKDYDKAQSEFERAIGINPDYSNALYFLGLVYDEKGKRSEAIEIFRRVAELNPNNAEVKKVIENLETGKTALDGIIEKEPPTVPIDESDEVEIDIEEKE